MKKIIRSLSLLVLVVSCNSEEPVPIPSPTLKIEFGYFAHTDCCIGTRIFSNQDSIYYQNLDSSIIVSIQEEYLTNPEIIGGNDKRNDEFTYTFVVETNQGDREVFVSDKNILISGGGSGDSSIQGVWYSEMTNDFIVPIDYDGSITESSGTIEIDRSNEVLFTVSYISQFSSLTIEDSIKIQP